MQSRTILSRCLITGFLILIGYSLAKAIYWGSFMGIILALISLGAIIYFVMLLSKAKAEMEKERVAETGEPY